MGTHSPVASIFITTYNRPETLRNISLPSALNQKCSEPFEVIVVDDCSPDKGETKRIVEELKKKHLNLHYVRHPVNKGLSAARNTGVENSKGEFVVSLDDDDSLLPTFLEKTLSEIRLLPAEFGAVFVARLVDYGQGRTEYCCGDPNESFYLSIDDGWLLRKSVFNKIKYDEEMLTDEDADFGIQFFQHFKAKAVTEALLVKYAHPIIAKQKKGFTSFSFPTERRFRGLKRFIERNEKIFESRGSRKDKGFFYRFVGRNYCWGGKMKEGIPYLLKAVKVLPTPRNILNLFAACFGAAPYRWYWYFESNGLRKLRSFISRRVLRRVKAWH